MYKITIEGDLPDLNTIIEEAKKPAKKYKAYADLKRDNTDLVTLYAKTQLNNKKFKKIDLIITWHCKDKRKDKDNISAGIKFILDGLVKARMIKNDGWGEINDFTHKFRVDKENPRVEIELLEVGE